MESSDLSTLMKRLSKEGYKIVYDPPGDGMCLHFAAAYQLCMDSSALKDMVFDYLQRNRFDVSICHLSVNILKSIINYNVFLQACLSMPFTGGPSTVSDS